MKLVIGIVLITAILIPVGIALWRRRKNRLNEQNDQVLNDRIKPFTPPINPELELRRKLNTKCGPFYVNPFREGALRFGGNASEMLLRQLNYPLYSCEADTMTGRHSDRIIDQNISRAYDCFDRHGVRVEDEHGFRNWLSKATDEAVLEFLIDFLQADAQVAWTGYRVTGSVNRGHGGVLYFFSLFAKHPHSTTRVFSGLNAPNVRSQTVRS